MLDRLAALPHGLGSGIETLLHGFKHVLMLALRTRVSVKRMTVSPRRFADGIRPRGIAVEVVRIEDGAHIPERMSGDGCDLRFSTAR